MKSSIKLALIQGFIVFILIGLLCLLLKNDFFFRNLAPIFGVLATFLRFLTANIIQALEKMAQQKGKE